MRALLARSVMLFACEIEGLVQFGGGGGVNHVHTNINPELSPWELFDTIDAESLVGVSALTSEPVTVRMDAIRGFPCASQCLVFVFASDIFGTARLLLRSQKKNGRVFPELGSVKTNCAAFARTVVLVRRSSTAIRRKCVNSGREAISSYSIPSQSILITVIHSEKTAPT